MLHLKSIAKQYGERILFSDVTLFINNKDRIGLVGSNGSGKTTFLRILCGQDPPDSGEIFKSSEIRIGYLPQEMNFYSENGLFNEAANVFENTNLIKAEIDLLHKKLEVEPENEKMLKRLGDLEHDLTTLGGENITYKIEKILFGLGFKERDFNRKVNEFSGGWKMRLLLAKLLLSEPSVLLLDEPTNHLDFESLEWLEEYLQSFKGAIIIVSHDKSFLNNLTQRTLEVYGGKINDYKGNYSFFTEEKEKRREVSLSILRNQQEKIKQTQRFIERFRYKATKARQVQSRIKMLDKMDIEEVMEEENSIDFEFPNPPPSGRIVATLTKVEKKFNDITVFENINLTIERGDRIAIVGPNGAGKSTLLKIIAGIYPIEKGSVEIGHNVIVSYFAQEQTLELDDKKNILETIDEVATGEIRKRIRTLLGSFLFSDDDVFKDIGVLSGGEKSRVALAKMLLTPANFLLMDEPTNHLDIKSKEILQNALKNFDGTYIIAAHDRDFLNPIINKVIEVNNFGIKVFPGNLQEYSYHKKQSYQIQHEYKTFSNNIKNESTSTSIKDKKRMEAEFRQKKYNLTKPVKDKIKSIEEKILLIEDRNKEIEGILANPETYKDGEKSKSFNQEYKENKENLTKIYEEWEMWQLKLEELENSITPEQ